MINIKDRFCEGYFDNSLIPSKLDNIVFNSAYLIITLPFVLIYVVYFFKPMPIYPYSVGNYISANYQHMIEEMEEINIEKIPSRYNIPLKCNELEK